MKHDALLRARKNTLDDFLTEGDEEYEIALKVVDKFLDYLENDITNAQTIEITDKGIEITSSDTQNEKELREMVVTDTEEVPEDSLT
jgi:antitoxin component HigA of HigAB toxin-antitoxin module